LSSIIHPINLYNLNIVAIHAASQEEEEKVKANLGVGRKRRKSIEKEKTLKQSSSLLELFIIIKTKK
jgi:hypothetical protein